MAQLHRPCANCSNAGPAMPSRSRPPTVPSCATARCGSWLTRRRRRCGRSGSALTTGSRSCCRTGRIWRRRSSRSPARATAAPLNPGYRAEEFEFYLTDLGAKALIVEAGQLLPGRGGRATARHPGAHVAAAPDARRRHFRLDWRAREALPRGRGAPAAGGRRADAAHLGHDLASEDRAAVACATCATSADNIAATLRAHGRATAASTSCRCSTSTG